MIGEDASNIFVHRNVASMVVNTDTNLLSALQQGVYYINVKHIIVCGHYESGGVRAAHAHNDFVAPLELWLRHVRDVYVKNSEEVDDVLDPDERHRKVVELTIVQQSVNILKTGVVQMRRSETSKSGEPYTAPLVHAMVFDPKTGALRRLDVDFNNFSEELTNVEGFQFLD
jgi:carbonic anhydrase